MNWSELFLADGTTSPKLMLWAFFIAVVIGTVIYYLINVRLGKLVARLIELDASTPESAVTLDEAEIKVGFMLNACLRSPLNYKDLLVAITADGKFYANSFYTDAPPTFRTLKAITRKRKSRIKATDTEANEASLDAENDANTAEATENPTENTQIQADPAETTEEAVYTEPIGAPQRVTFNPMTAKYYIPKEVHDKVKSIYKKPKVKLVYLILLLILFGAVIYLAGFALDLLLAALPKI